MAEGHSVTLHARSESRAAATKSVQPEAESVLVADVSSLAGIRQLADQANGAGPFDAVIHNVALGDQARQHQTEDGLDQLFTVNVLAPYLLTALMSRPQRLIYLSSGMHCDGDPNLSDAQWTNRPWNGTQAYSDSKLFDTTLAFAVARLWPDVKANAVDPGWVKTKMGGAGAPDDIETGSATQAWLAAGGSDATGEYFYKQEALVSHQATDDVGFQTDLLALCAKLTGVALSA